MDKLGKMAGRLLQTVKPSPFTNLGYPYMPLQAKPEKYTS